MSVTPVHTNGNKSVNAKSNAHLQEVLHDAPADGGKLIVLTAPLTETIDHAGYFIQMGMASMPTWMEGVLNRKYPNWRDVEYNEDRSAPPQPALHDAVPGSSERVRRSSVGAKPSHNA